MAGEHLSILIIAEPTIAHTKLRDAMKSCSPRCRLVAPNSVSDPAQTPSEGPPDIVLIDVAAANGNAAALLDLVKRMVSGSPDVIALKAHNESQGKDLLDMGATEYLLSDRSDQATVIRTVQAVAERRGLADALTQSEERYARLLESVTDYTYSVRIEGRFPVSSLHRPGCTAVTGYTPDEYAADDHLWYRMIHPADRDAVIAMSHQACAGQTPPPLEHRIIHKNGSVRWIKNTAIPRYDSQGHLTAYDGLVTDITGRKQAEQELLRVNRALQALSQCSQALVRTADEAQLLSTVCGIIIDIGGYRMCWVGSAENDEKRRILPTVWAGHEDGYLATIFPTWSDEAKSRGPCGVAVRTCRPVVIRNIAAEPGDAFWRAEALKRGYGSLVVFPLLARGTVFSVLAIYAAEPNVFDDQEVKHLRDLADDLAYGITALRDRVEHRQVEAALRDSEEKRKLEFANLQRAKQEWEVTFDSISDPIFIHDRECRIIRANQAYREITGLSFTELIGKPFYSIFPRLEDSVLSAWLGQEDLDDRHPYYVEEFAVPTLRRIFRGRVYPIPDENGAVQYCVQVLEDVTEMKKAEENMRQEMEISTNLLALAETATDTLDPDRLLERVVTCCARILATDTFLSYSWDNAARVLRPGQHTPLPHGMVPMFRTDASASTCDLSQIALESRHACVARKTEGSDSGEDVFLLEQLGGNMTPAGIARPFPWLQNTDTFLAIPLYGKTECLGLLVAAYRDDRDFSERDRRIVEGISREVSLALDEACLYRTALERSMELAHKMETLKVIHEIDLNILSSLEPQGILETAVRNIRRIIPCDAAEAMLTGPDREFLARISSERNGREHDSVTRLPLVSTAAAEVLATCRPSYLPDISKAGALLPEEERLRADGIRTLFRVPLMAKGSAIGVLSVASARPAAFTPENFATLEQLTGLIGVAFENTRLLTDLQELLLGTVKSLSYAIDAKSSWTAGHSERVTRYALQLGKELGMSEAILRDLELAGLLHDVGKLGTFDAILDKKTVLSTEEFEIIKRHPLHGAELLAPIKQMKQIIPAVRHHHERFDGKGYPDGLKGQQIPALARILAVADAFDSMTGWRPYRKTFDLHEAVAELRRCSGTQFDPSLADKFITMVHKSDTLKTGFKKVS